MVKQIPDQMMTKNEDEKKRRKKKNLKKKLERSMITEVFKILN